MQTTSELLDAVKARHDIKSEYRLCRTLGVTDQTLRNYRIGSTRPDDRVATLIADSLGVDPLYVIACVNAERTQDARLRSIWSNLAQRLERAGAVVAVVTLLGASMVGGPDAYAMAAQPHHASASAGPLYIM